MAAEDGRSPSLARTANQRRCQICQGLEEPTMVIENSLENQNQRAGRILWIAKASDILKKAVRRCTALSQCPPAGRTPLGLGCCRWDGGSLVLIALIGVVLVGVGLVEVGNVDGGLGFGNGAVVELDLRRLAEGEQVR